MPKRQPSLGREPGQKLRNYEQSVKRARLFCTKFHELIRRFHPPVSICSHLLPIIPTLYSRELFEFASPLHCRASHRSSSKRLPMQHSACPTFMRETHYVASKFPLFRNAVFCPCFHVTRINHFSHALIPIMQNFVPHFSEPRLTTRSHAGYYFTTEWVTFFIINYFLQFFVEQWRSWTWFFVEGFFSTVFKNHVETKKTFCSEIFCSSILFVVDLYFSRICFNLMDIHFWQNRFSPKFSNNLHE